MKERSGGPRTLRWFVPTLLAIGAIYVFLDHGPIDDQMPQRSEPDRQVAPEPGPPVSELPPVQPSARTQRPTLEAAPARAGELGSILGLAVNLAGDPAPGAEVFLRRGEDEQVVRTVADQLGAFEFMDLEPGALLIDSGADTVAHSELNLRPGESIRDLLVIVCETKSLYGLLLGPDGEPIPNAKVYLRGERDSDSPYLTWTNRERFVRTDDNGTFSFTDVPAAAMKLFVNPYRYTIETSAVAPDQRRIEVQCRGKDQRIVIEGRVTDPSGTPLAGARIEQTGLGSHRKDITDDAGRFALPSTVSSSEGASRTAVLEAVAPGFAPSLVRIPIRPDFREGDSVPPVDVALREAFALTGHVVDASGARIRAGLTLYEAGAELGDKSLLSLMDARFQRSTEEEGFRVDGLWGAEFEVVVKVGTDVHSIHRLDPRQGPFVLRPDSGMDSVVFDVSVRQHANGRPIDRYFVGVYRGGGGGGVGKDRPGGKARLVERGPAEIGLEIKADGYARAWLEKRHFDPGEYRIDVHLPRIRDLRVRVVDTSGRPLRGLKLRVAQQRLSGGDLTPTSREFGGTTALDGRCWLTRVPENAAPIEVIDPATRDTLFTIDLADHEPKTEHTIVIESR